METISSARERDIAIDIEREMRAWGRVFAGTAQACLASLASPRGARGTHHVFIGGVGIATAVVAAQSHT